jgi:hypothetical protein
MRIAMTSSALRRRSALEPTRHPRRCCKRRLWQVLAGALLAPLVASTSPALADGPQAPTATVDKAECALTFERAQRLRNASSYLSASAEALKCANPGCGTLLSEECGKIYSELQTAIPTVVFAARDEAGRELANVSVRIDQDPNPIPLDGKPVAIDPGNHEFAFSAAGFEPATQGALIRAAERYRAVNVTLQPLVASKPAQPRSVEHTSSNAGVPLASYVLGGVAIVGVAGFAAFRLSGSSDFDTLSRECKPTCEADQVDDVRSKYLFSHVSLAVGGAAALAAVTIYLTAPKASATTTALQIKPSRAGIAAHLTTRF